MTTFIDLMNFAIVVSGLTMALSGFILALSLRSLGKETRLFFIAFFCIMTAYTASDLLSQIFLALSGEFATHSKTAIFLESFFASLLLPLLTRFLLYCGGGEEQSKSPWLYVSATLWELYLLLLVVTQFTDKIYTITLENVYLRGPFYPVLLCPPALLMLVNLLLLLRLRRRLSARQTGAFLTYILLPLAAMLVQMVNYGLLLIVFATACSALIMFTQVVREQMERIVRQMEENARQQADIMVLQMRPHFIYNTLSSVYYLCESDPKRAQRVLGDFTAYLRQNFSAVAKRGLIPFSEELEHTRAYLTVEKNRYETLLFVEYDTPHIAFYLPPLTLQPIVENAVKHGVDPELSPLHIRIRTRQAEGESVIIVEDTGQGFAPSKDESGVHIGIDNVTGRLRFMCGGQLEITQSESGGTVVTIRIPDKSA